MPYVDVEVWVDPPVLADLDKEEIFTLAEKAGAKVIRPDDLLEEEGRLERIALLLEQMRETAAPGDWRHFDILMMRLEAEVGVRDTLLSARPQAFCIGGAA